MACSSPLLLNEYSFGSRSRFSKSHVSLEKIARNLSFNNLPFIQIPCRYCTNCRIDRQNEIVDRAEYEYIKYGCGAFVTFTYDEPHLDKNVFFDTRSGSYIATINKKDGKDFLNRLNKLVHKHNKELRKKKILFNPLCREDYKYLITYEYGDTFNRPHMHVLFFGLDFAYCQRMFWKAWNYQGEIQVGAIKNGGIEYCTKYITEQQFGLESRFKFDYHHLERPSSSHSVGFGSGLYLDQLDHIKKTGNYVWHNKERPVPTYWKNKLNVIADLKYENHLSKYQAKIKDIKNKYKVDINDFYQFTDFNNSLAKTRQKNIEIKLMQHAKKILDSDYILEQKNNILYNNNHRLPTHDYTPFFTLIYPDGTFVERKSSKFG